MTRHRQHGCWRGTYCFHQRRFGRCRRRDWAWAGRTTEIIRVLTFSWSTISGPILMDSIEMSVMDLWWGIQISHRAIQSAVGSAESEGDLSVVHQGFTLVRGDERRGLRLQQRARGLGLIDNRARGLCSAERVGNVVFSTH